MDEDAAVSSSRPSVASKRRSFFENRLISLFYGLSCISDPECFRLSRDLFTASRPAFPVAIPIAIPKITPNSSSFCTFLLTFYIADYNALFHDSLL
jgi:hypothetical protein